MPRTSKERWYKHTVCVSERDREIYDQVAVVGRPQREVAKEFKISQPRVSKIVNRVFAWMCETAPYGYAEVPRSQRLYGVARTYKRKLEWYENEAKGEWLKSKTDEPWTSTHDLTKASDGKTLVAEPRKLTRKAAKADVKYLKQAEEFAFKLVHFEGFERNGAVPRHNNDRLFEMPPTIPGEELDDMIAVGHRAAEIKRRREAESGRGGEGESGRMRSDRSVGERDVVLSPTPPLSPSPTPPQIGRYHRRRPRRVSHGKSPSQMIFIRGHIPRLRRAWWRWRRWPQRSQPGGRQRVAQGASPGKTDRVTPQPGGRQNRPQRICRPCRGLQLRDHRFPRARALGYFLTPYGLKAMRDIRATL